jgi:hypothetical protein
MIRVTKSWELHHTHELWDEIVTWCITQFGNDRGRWQSQATTTYMEFNFNHEVDAELFILKWM